MIISKRRYLAVLCLFVSFLLLMTGCGSKSSEKKEDTGKETGMTVEENTEERGSSPESAEIESSREEENVQEDVEEFLSGMTLEEKVAQLFVVLPEAITGYDVVTAAGEATREAINEYPVGGFAYMSQNLESEEQVTEMLASVQQYSMERIGLPMFTCVDEEGGTVSRVGGSGLFDVPYIGNMSEVGAGGSTDLAYEDGQIIGFYLDRMGFNVDFAPVADVLGYEGYELLMYRSFGTDPDLVAEMTRAFRHGLEESNVQAVYKHFPGHGAASGDSHEGYVQVEQSMDELKECDLIPFQDGIDDGLGWIMVSHISLPYATSDGLPASLSHEICTDLLRTEMGFQGIIITDAMNMGAIANNYSSADASVLALQAGVDLLLAPVDFHSAYQGVLAAVSDGRLTEERIDESVRRIIRSKMELTDI